MSEIKGTLSQLKYKPDYAHATLIDKTNTIHNFTYVAPSNGVLMSSGAGNKTSTSYIYFIPNANSNIKVMSESNSGLNISAQMILKKGDTVFVYSYLPEGSNGTYFIPFI